ncbi:LuxR C-terminal-related transcriptional regulator [Pseudonocardia endophytica]|uniref:LuxR C-terminal-related transcriptional regulator n=1 Tax=Pseudonocardia endophytica TaxID=401976 RepID=UPI00104C9148|nr:LuxR family transcriptional regulator [Pseudonocardia endophytica]
MAGRGAERAAIVGRARDVVDGHPAVVWVEGEAGAGKSALVDAVVGDLPDGFGVLRAEADELDVEEPLALAAQLGAGGSGSAGHAASELLRGWSAAQDRGPLAVVVEDLHWADPDSRTALLGAVRRLAGDRVLVVVTSRPGATDGWARFALDARRCLRVDVGALTGAEVAELGALHGVGLGPDAAARLHAHTAGHALHVRTLLTELSPEQLTRRDGVLPAPRSLAATTLAALTALPAPTRELALALATVARPIPLPTVARIAGVAPDAADALVASGLARVRDGDAGDEIAFAHPLHRVAVWDDLAPSRRRAWHRAAARHLGARESLMHRVAAAEGPDDALGADLEIAATGLGRVPAARMLLAAAGVSTGERAERLLLDAVALLVAAGRHRQAAAHRPAVESCADGPHRDLVLGMLDWEAGDAGPAEAALSRAAAPGGPPGIVTAATVRLAVLLYTAGRGDEAVATAVRALAMPGLTTEDEREAWIALAVGEQMRSGAVAGLARLEPRLPPVVADPADTDLLVARGTLEFFAARPARAVADLTAAIQLSHAAPTMAGDRLTRAHLQLANAQILTGDWASAAIHARLASRLVDEEDLVWVRAQTEGIHARLAGCVRGDWTAAEAHLRAAGEAVGQLGSLEAAFTTLIARALVADARQDPREILTVFGGLVAGAAPVPMSTALTWWPMVVDAALDVGDTATAAELLARLRTAAEERSIDLHAVVTGLGARLDEARGDVEGAIAGYERATEALGPEVVLLDRGKLLHRHGRLLLDRGDPASARERLEAALAVFGHAAPYEARVRRDLDRIRAASPSVPVQRGAAELTEREREVVALVARGMTNREVAAELYVTDKAVEYHLGNVFAKLGIRSRRALRDLTPVPH